ncbi:MAG: uncharacterized protein JWM59_3815 [Verrucomicrobiales bacterium]|nr:uncharacterized protein [Verrucomicrobiales bacterium]
MRSSSKNFGDFGGNWTVVKLAAVTEYFSSFNRVLSKTPFKRVYIDAFAGGGRIKQTIEKKAGPKLTPGSDWFPEDSKLEENSVAEEFEETESIGFRHGSPLLALEANPGFDEFIFIERDQAVLDQLKEQVKNAQSLQGRPVQFICEDANTALSRICRPDWSKRFRATIFLDPFALQIHWATLEKIARTKGMDMWMLFPAMAVNRMLPRNGKMPEVWAQRLNETFGDTTWRQEFYATPQIPQNDDLFPELLPNPQETKLDDPFGRLSRYVTRRLKTVFVDAVEEPLVLKTALGAPLFLLCFAVANKKGAPIAKRIANHIIKNQNNGH